VHRVLAPFARLVTVNTVPNGRVGLAQVPAGASEYHVAWPCSVFPTITGTGAAIVVVVVSTGAGAEVTGVTDAVTFGDVTGATGAE
jgi:hypothetical protein